MAFACRWIIARDIPPLIPFSSFSEKWTSQLQFFTSVFFKAAFHANPGAETKWTGSLSYISIHLFQKISNISASKDFLCWKNRSGYSSRFFLSKSFHSFWKNFPYLRNSLYIQVTVKLVFFQVMMYSYVSLYSYGSTPFRNIRHF